MNLDQARGALVQEARELLVDMEDALLEIESDGYNAERVNAIFRAAHTIKGSAGLFGLESLINFTHVVESLLDFGRTAHDHRGAQIVFFDKAARQQLARERGAEALRRLGKRLRAYLVVNADGDVLTVGHRTRRIQRG